jgi:UDP-N-acetylglucosamine acyltransferase
VGARCTIREHVTVNAGSSGSAEGGLTRVGNGVLLMAGCHVAHDCRVGDGAVVANGALLAGHVTLGAGAIVGGNAAVRQKCRVGRGAMLGGLCSVDGDVIPFGLIARGGGVGVGGGGGGGGGGAHLRGLNLVGLRRSGHAREDVKLLLAAHRYIFAGSPASSFAPPLPLRHHAEMHMRVAEAVRYVEEEAVAAAAAAPAAAVAAAAAAGTPQAMASVTDELLAFLLEGRTLVMP